MQRTPKLRRIRKVWHKGLRSLPAIDGRRYRAGEAIKPLLDGINVEFDVTPDDVNELARVIGDDSLARRLRKMQREKFQYATIPELMLVDYLDRIGERYTFQAQLYGGHRRGGVVPDFVLTRGTVGRAILVNGNYWHNVPGMQQKDEADKLRLKGSYFEGVRIEDTVILWESRLMQPNPGREQAIQDAVQGIELGP